MTIGRGMTFALELPESADAHYAGKGVKLGEPDRPIFWYKPEGAKTYRVIYADLSVKEAEQSPEVAGAVRLEKTRPAGKRPDARRQATEVARGTRRFSAAMGLLLIADRIARRIALLEPLVGPPRPRRPL